MTNKYQNTKWLTPFKDIRDLDNYFSQELITCLECGLEMKALGGHIRIHCLTARDYKIKYNIPQGRKLACESTKQKLRDSREIQVSQWTEEERKAEQERSSRHLKKLTKIAACAPRYSTIEHGSYVKNCKECGVEFTTHAHKDKKFCSQICSNRATFKTRKRVVATGQLV